MGLLDKLFGKKENKSKIQSLNTPISEIKKDREEYINVGQSIFPVIKSIDDPRIKMAANNNPLLVDPLSDGIVTCYVLDMGDNFEMLSQSHLENFGLSIEDIRQVAQRNFINKVNADCKIGIMDFSEQNPLAKPFYKVDIDANFNPSLMLLDEFWETTAKEVTNAEIIAVTIPAKNLLFFSDIKLMESFRTMRPVAENMYDASISEGIALTKNTYFRKNGKWILFLNSPEQMVDEDLY
ncbi:DUF1444 family protein [Flavobacterium sp. LC2016-01]|uniref:DUF1444 family protein n=1 Tax=Flavobacterium sp. LC2016-01 TaxID=2675876 RepID=UPI0012BACBA1|nr:DUF1444 family protein [Flavobacterium sp. LC2016-01]MTH17336.1 DUF1444 family protein [Flavobacterium sp. LC2016-01]